MAPKTGHFGTERCQKQPIPALEEKPNIQALPKKALFLRETGAFFHTNFDDR